MNSKNKLALSIFLVLLLFVGVIGISNAQLFKKGGNAPAPEEPEENDNFGAVAVVGDRRPLLDKDEIVAAIDNIGEQRRLEEGERFERGRFLGIDSYGQLYVDYPENFAIVSTGDIWTDRDLYVNRHLEVWGNAYMDGEMYIRGPIKAVTGDVIVRIGR